MGEPWALDLVIKCNVWKWSLFGGIQIHAYLFSKIDCHFTIFVIFSPQYGRQNAAFPQNPTFLFWLLPRSAFLIFLKLIQNSPELISSKFPEECFLKKKKALLTNLLLKVHFSTIKQFTLCLKFALSNYFLLKTLWIHPSVQDLQVVVATSVALHWC